MSDLQFIPYKRFMCAKHLLKHISASNITSHVANPELGGVLIKSGLIDKPGLIKFFTAIAFLFGRPIPEPSGNYYGLTTITYPEKDQPKLKILDPYSTFTLHTDGIFADNPVDWILMGKMYEKNAVGGESRLLHISDFDLFETFESEPIMNTIFDFGLSDIDKRHDIFAQVSNLVPGQSRLLYRNGKDKMVKFVDQFILPKTLEQAHLIERL